MDLDEWSEYQRLMADELDLSEREKSILAKTVFSKEDPTIVILPGTHTETMVYCMLNQFGEYCVQIKCLCKEKRPERKKSLL